jgi:hypothetical protein
VTRQREGPRSRRGPSEDDALGGAVGSVCIVTDSTPSRADVGAAVAILRDIIDGDLDPAYWRIRVMHALEALGAAVGP